MRVNSDLRLGRYQDVLADMEVDAVITDPPYSERTHSVSPSYRRVVAPDLSQWAIEDPQVLLPFAEAQ